MEGLGGRRRVHAVVGVDVRPEHATHFVVRRHARGRRRLAWRCAENHACAGARAVEVAIDAWMHCRLAEGAAVLGSKAKADTDGRRERWRTWW